jgi:hypothetical protein
MANPMRNIRIEKLTLNVGAGSDQDKLEKGIVLIERITGSKSVKTLTQERIPSWGLGKPANRGKNHTQEIPGCRDTQENPHSKGQQARAKEFRRQGKCTTWHGRIQLHTRA